MMTDWDNTVGFWNFSETTLTEQYQGNIANYECFQIVGRFLIVR